MDYNTRIKENLYDLNNGYYLSKNDPLFWRKLLSIRPENREAMYHVGLDLEIDAKYHLGKYYTTKINKYLILYRKIIRQSSDLIKRSFNRGFVLARPDILRMEREIKITEQKISTSIISNNSACGKKAVLLISLFVFSFILGIVLATHFVSYKVSNTTTTNYLSTHYAYINNPDIPYKELYNHSDNLNEEYNSKMWSCQMYYWSD